jgi:isoquinoline 1-oxidoreductase beta subunit
MTTTASRRAFLLSAAAVSGGLVLGFTLPGAGRFGAMAQARRAGSPFDGYVAIARDGKVTVTAAHMEMGQGIQDGIATLVAEELGVAMDAVEVVGGAGNPALYGNIAWGGQIQGTGGSTGLLSSWERYRRAGATVRAMLIRAAASAWDVPPGRVAAEAGVLSSGMRRATYGEMAEAAARQPVPADVALKNPADWSLIGKQSTHRVAGRDKVTGARTFTIDLKLPGLLTAVVAHPPRFGATVARVDASAARRVSGVVDVVTISRGVAVVATNTWAAIKGREALRVDWNEANAERRGSADLAREYASLATRPGTVAADRGDAAGALSGAGSVIEATYEFPYLAHAALEPLDAVVRRSGDLLEVWGGHQMPDLYQAVAAQVAGLTPDRVRLNVMPTGGGFGRRAVLDADIIVEAVETAKAIGWRAPVKVMWTREDDMTGGRYRPLYVHRVRASLGRDNRVAAWHHHIVGQSIMIGTPFEAFTVRNGVDATSVEGASDLPYAIPNFRAEVTNTRVGVPVLWWRAVGHTHTAYAVETMIDELARAAGQDAVAFRLAHLDPASREAGVLRLAADKAGWANTPAEGIARGVALHKSFGTYVAMVLEARVSGRAVKVERVVAAVDCGVAVNPDVIRAQIEGGVGFGLGSVLSSELTLAGGVVEQRNYDSFEILRIDAMPAVEVHIAPSAMPPTGIGEPGVPPIGPALANAVAAATGRRVRVLPFAKGMGAA